MQAANNVTGTMGYAYDIERRLTRVHLSVGTSVQLQYDPNSLRVQKTDDSDAVTNDVLDGLQALLEKGGAGTTQVGYVPGLARIAGDAVGFALEDRLGSVVGLADANQNVADAFWYDAWDNLLQHQGTTGTAYQWIGGEGCYLDPDVGLDLLGLRRYAPEGGGSRCGIPWASEGST